MVKFNPMIFWGIVIVLVIIAAYLIAPYWPMDKQPTEDCFRIYIDEEMILEYSGDFGEIPIPFRLDNLDNNTHHFIIRKINKDFCTQGGSA